MPRKLPLCSKAHHTLSGRNRTGEMRASGGMVTVGGGSSSVSGIQWQSNTPRYRSRTQHQGPGTALARWQYHGSHPSVRRRHNGPQRLHLDRCSRCWCVCVLPFTARGLSHCDSGAINIFRTRECVSERVSGVSSSVLVSRSPINHSNLTSANNSESNEAILMCPGAPEMAKRCHRVDCSVSSRP